MPDPRKRRPGWDTVHGSHQSTSSHGGQGTDTVFRPRGQSTPGTTPGQPMTEEEKKRRQGIRAGFING